MLKRKRKYPLELNIQYFAEGDKDSSASDQGSNDDDPKNGAKGDQKDGNGVTPDQQAEIDRIRNHYSHENKKLMASIQEMQTTIQQLQDSGKSKEQLAKEAEDRLKAGHAELLKSKNEFYAARKLADAGLKSDLLSFVTVNEGDNEEARNGVTDARIKALVDVINEEVKSQVEAKFKAAGYNPGQGTGDKTPKATPRREIAERHRILK